MILADNECHAYRCEQRYRQQQALSTRGRNLRVVSD